MLYICTRVKEVIHTANFKKRRQLENTAKFIMRTSNKNNVNHWSISNNCAGRILRMQELKNEIGQTIDASTFLRKNTMSQVKSEMKQVFGKVLNEIPKAFIHNNCIWKSSISVYTHKNRQYESFKFIPVYNL